MRDNFDDYEGEYDDGPEPWADVALRWLGMLFVACSALVTLFMFLALLAAFQS